MPLKYKTRQLQRQALQPLPVGARIIIDSDQGTTAPRGSYTPATGMSVKRKQSEGALVEEQRRRIAQMRSALAR